MEKKQLRVVVIGSGISGVKAAFDLSAKGHDVVVLEAQDHIGGRTTSEAIKLGDGSIFNFDMGASWVHQSCGAHPITKMAKEAQIKLVKTNEQISQWVDHEGKLINKGEVGKQWDIYDKLKKKLEDTDKEMSVLQGISKKNPQGLKNPLFMQQVTYDMQFNTSAQIKDLSAWQAYNDDQFDGQQMLVTGGYDKICKYMKEEEEIQILYNHEVVEVRATQAGRSEVVCRNGKVFEADRVVVSVPLGALKKQAIKFAPALPQWKQQAIEKMGVGNVCKVLLVFEKSPVDSKLHYFTVLSEQPKDSGLMCFFLNLYTLIGKPLLMTYGLGSSADAVERMSQNELKKIVCQRLRAYCKQEIPPESFRVYRSKWRDNGNFGGAYSYPRVGCSYKQYEALSRPLPDLGWYFCGEHTTCRYRSSVHGAFLSGRFVADAIASGKNWEYFDQKWHKQNQSD